MKCPECEAEMTMMPNVLLSNPPQYQYECYHCGCYATERVQSNAKISPVKQSYAIDFAKVGCGVELINVLNAINITISPNNPKYEYLKKYAK